MLNIEKIVGSVFVIIVALVNTFADSPLSISLSVFHSQYKSSGFVRLCVCVCVCDNFALQFYTAIYINCGPHFNNL